MLATLCLILALACALLSAAGIPEYRRWRPLSAAVAFIVLALLLARLPWPPS